MAEQTSTGHRPRLRAILRPILGVQKPGAAQTPAITPPDPQPPWRPSFESFHDALVLTCYRVILGREPEPAALAVLTAPPLPAEQEDIIWQVVDRFFASEEALARHQRIVKDRPVLNPYSRPPGRVVCFIHLEKCGGTTLDAAISSDFADGDIFRTDNIRMYRFAPSELANFKYISGHMDYNDTVHLPYKTVFRIAVLREPVERLISVYRFQKAHPLKDRKSVV